MRLPQHWSFLIKECVEMVTNGLKIEFVIETVEILIHDLLV